MFCLYCKSDQDLGLLLSVLKYDIEMTLPYILPSFQQCKCQSHPPAIKKNGKSEVKMALVISDTVIFALNSSSNNNKIMFCFF